MLSPADLTAYALRGGPHIDDPKDRERPDTIRPVGYLPIDPGTETPPDGLGWGWHRLGAACRPADELMHRFYLASMRALVENPRTHGGKAFYPDEAGMLVACVLLRTSLAPRLAFIGYDARAVYVAGAVALASTAGGLLPESMR